MRALLIKNAKIHGTIFIGLILFALLFVFILGQFNTLHPDAYKDIVMSIVYVYVIIIIILIPLTIVKAKVDPETLNNFVLFKWHSESGLVSNIAFMFVLITIVNSIMMLTGIDAPKEGAFSYTHLLTRLGIVTVASVLWMIKNYIEYKKGLRHFNPFRLSLNALKHKLYHYPVIFSMILFTVITTIGCLVMLLFSQFFTVSGGANLYLSLIIMYGVLLVASLITYKKIR